MKDEDAIETRLQELELNAPRLSPEKIDAVIAGATYTTLPSGKAMICELTLINGFTVRGESAVVSKANFNEEIGRKIAYQRARDMVWGFEGYLLQQRLFEEAVATKQKAVGEKEFRREARYVVVKIKDIDAAGCTDAERDAFNVLCDKVSRYRISSAKGLLECVVVEKDWPEFEPTWKAIEERMKG